MRVVLAAQAIESLTPDEWAEVRAWLAGHDSASYAAYLRKRADEFYADEAAAQHRGGGLQGPEIPFSYVQAKGRAEITR